MQNYCTRKKRVLTLHRLKEIAMITFDPPSKINAVNLLPAFIAHGEVYEVHTTKKVVVDGEEQTVFDDPITTPNVHLLFKMNRSRKPIIIAFPIGDDRPIHRPAFYVVPAAHQMLDRKSTHTVFDNGNWVLCRPIEAVYNKVVTSLSNKDLYFVENMRTLMAHAYLCDLIGDETLTEVAAGIDKLEKIAAKADIEANPSQQEVEVAWSMAQKAAGNILKKMRQ